VTADTWEGNGGSYTISNGCESGIIVVVKTRNQDYSCDQDIYRVGRGDFTVVISYFNTPPNLVFVCSDCNLRDVRERYGNGC
jgi:hypothetical protein